MEKIFPPTTSKPEKIQIFTTIPCWIWIFVLFPMFMPFIGLGIWEHDQYGAWLEVFYHAANGLLILWLIFRYLKEDWFMVTTDFRYYLRHIALTVGLAVGAVTVLWVTFLLLGFDITGMLNNLPVVELSVNQTPLLLIGLEPVLGTITLSLFVPISVCGLFYCFGFAPVCYKKPWLAYLCIAVITLIPPIINILWRGQAILVLSGYLVQLPIHLLMCWSYQKTDNVWTPLVSLMIFNLLASVVLPLIPFELVYAAFGISY